MKQDIIAATLIDAIQEQVDQELHQTRAMLEAEFQKEMKNYRDSLEEETKMFIQQELAELRLSLIQNESTAKWRLKQDLLETRRLLVSSLFDEIYEKLKQFTLSSAYPLFLVKTLETLKTTTYPSGSIVVRSSDAEIVSSWIQHQNVSMQVVVDPKNTLGGFLFVSENKRFEFDHTLETTLACQKQWFYENSNLLV